jgi:hypothetical protein
VTVIINKNVVEKAACFSVHSSGCMGYSIFMNEMPVCCQFSKVLKFEIDTDTSKTVVNPNFLPEYCLTTLHIFCTLPKFSSLLSKIFYNFYVPVGTFIVQVTA